MATSTLPMMVCFLLTILEIMVGPHWVGWLEWSDCRTVGDWLWFTILYYRLSASPAQSLLEQQDHHNILNIPPTFLNWHFLLCFQAGESDSIHLKQSNHRLAWSGTKTLLAEDNLLCNIFDLKTRSCFLFLRKAQFFFVFFFLWLKQIQSWSTF